MSSKWKTIISTGTYTKRPLRLSHHKGLSIENPGQNLPLPKPRQDIAYFVWQSGQWIESDYHIALFYISYGHSDPLRHKPEPPHEAVETIALFSKKVMGIFMTLSIASSPFFQVGVLVWSRLYFWFGVVWIRWYCATISSQDQGSLVQDSISFLKSSLIRWIILKSIECNSGIVHYDST